VLTTYIHTTKLIDWCLTPTVSVFQQDRGVNTF